MRDVSDAFLRTIRGSHRALFRATVCETFQTGTSPSGTRVAILPDSEVNLDGTAQIRGTARVSVAGFGAWPTTVDSLLAPYGNELYLERGVQYHDGPDGAEWVGFGYFRIDEPEQGDAPRGPIVLPCSDRMAGIVEARLLAPVQFDEGTTLGTIVDDLVLGIYPSATIEWDDATDAVTIARSLICERERYEFLDDLVRAQGKVWYWDHRGVLVIRSMPDSTVPVWDIELARGGGAALGIQVGGTLIGMGRSLSRLGTFNAVVANGQGADSNEPAYAAVADVNPESPTYFLGRFGQVPQFYTSQFVADDAQAEAAATALLQQLTGLPYSVDLALTPHPGLEPWDPVTVRAHASESTERHTIASLTIPLNAREPMTAVTRQQSVILPGSV